MSHDDEYVDTAHVAKLLKFAPRTVTDMARRGRLPGAKQISREWRFHLPTLRAWLSAAQEPKSCPSRTAATGRRSTKSAFRLRMEAIVAAQGSVT